MDANKVDVLAVLDSLVVGAGTVVARQARKVATASDPGSLNARNVWLQTAQKNHSDAKEARAAVAFLIAAAKIANGDHVAPDDCYATGPLTGNRVEDFIVCPGCRLNAALAQVQP